MATGLSGSVDGPAPCAITRSTVFSAAVSARDNDRTTMTPITRDDADEYLREQVLAATLVGIPAEIVPSSVTAMEHYFSDVRSELELTDDATRGVKVLISPPMPKKVRLLTPARPAWAGLAGMAFALMPGWARKLYRMPGLPTTDLAATAALRALRTGLQVLPDRWTGPPEVLAARAEIEALDEQRAPAMDSDGRRAG